MKVSLLVPTYKDTIALRLILEALQRQTYKNFEVVIAEDDNADETKELVKKFDELEIQHIFQEDNGNRKATILNKALSLTQGEYLIFIDGDTIPFSTFIESNVALAEPKTVLCGRRVNLGHLVSKDIRAFKKSIPTLEYQYIRHFNYLKKGGTRHFEQGLRFRPNSMIQRWLMTRNKNVHIVGSNFSCFREDIFAINGFDEDITGGSKDDVDLEWRFVMSGCRLKSSKYCANLFHLDHSRTSRIEDEEIARLEMQENQKKQRFICSNGIQKID
ncbi:MAG TPA: glycosyltransferase [Campylobacterales bacterium]|nr:glycosyltransferase [Bacteroidota bacterium]HHS93014.1 glycosyltransferase [Campylobacterales bacterium]